MLNVRLAGDHREIAVQLAVAVDVIDGVFLYCPFPTRCLG